MPLVNNRGLEPISNIEVVYRTLGGTLWAVGVFRLIYETVNEGGPSFETFVIIAFQGLMGLMAKKLFPGSSLNS